MVYAYKMIGSAPPGLYPLINGKIAWVILFLVRARGKNLVWLVPPPHFWEFVESFSLVIVTHAGNSC